MKDHKIIHKDSAHLPGGMVYRLRPKFFHSHYEHIVSGMSAEFKAGRWYMMIRPLRLCRHGFHTPTKTRQSVEYWRRDMIALVAVAGNMITVNAFTPKEAHEYMYIIGYCRRQDIKNYGVNTVAKLKKHFQKEYNEFRGKYAHMVEQ